MCFLLGYLTLDYKVSKGILEYRTDLVKGGYCTEVGEMVSRNEGGRQLCVIKQQ